MSWTIQTALILGRVSNLPTVWTNTFAGVILAGASPSGWCFAFVVLAMTLAYTGGMFLNDAFDANIDATERPERPIPQGSVSRTSVYVVGYSLLIVSVLLVAWCALIQQAGNWPAVFSATALAGVIVLYNRWHKSNPISPVIMGICRMLVYITAGLTLSNEPSSMLYIGAFLLLCYLIGLTYTAKQENIGQLKNTWPLLFLAAPWLAGLYLALEHAPVLVPLLLLTALLILALYLITRRESGDIRRAVVSLIAGISIVDAVLIATLDNTIWFVFALLGFVATLSLQKWISGT